MSLSAAQKAAADAAVREARRAYAQARPLLERAADSWWNTDAARSVLKAFNDTHALMETWATKRRADVERGAEGYEAWMAAGKVFAETAGSMAGVTVNSTLFGVAKAEAAEAVAEAKKDLQEAAKAALTGLGWVHAVGAVLAVGVLLYVLAPYARAAGVAQ